MPGFASLHRGLIRFIVFKSIAFRRIALNFIAGIHNIKIDTKSGQKHLNYEKHLQHSYLPSGILNYAFGANHTECRNW